MMTAAADNTARAEMNVRVLFDAADAIRGGHPVLWIISKP